MDRAELAKELQILLNRPEEFWQDQIDSLLRLSDPNPPRRLGLAPQLREVFLALYDMNPPEDQELTKATSGMVAHMNRWADKGRDRRSRRRQNRGKNKTKIYAEGDSWFQHPLIKDVIERLNGVLDKDRYVLYSGAAASDWLINYIQGREYIHDISRIRPHVILLSGGGNDIMGDGRVAFLLDEYRTNFSPMEEARAAAKSNGTSNREAWLAGLGAVPAFSRLLGPLGARSDKDVERLFTGVSYLSRDALRIMLFLKLSYHYVVRSIRNVVPDARIVTHGYAEVFPRRRVGHAFPRFYRMAASRLTGVGEFFHDPMHIKNITQPETQRDIMFTIVTCFYAILGDLAENRKLGGNIAVVDARPALPRVKDWFDEIHPSGTSARRVAKAFYRAIRADANDGPVFPADPP